MRSRAAAADVPTITIVKSEIRTAKIRNIVFP
jgi:hypothetical protein